MTSDNGAKTGNFSGKKSAPYLSLSSINKSNNNNNNNDNNNNNNNNNNSTRFINKIKTLCKASLTAAYFSYQKSMQ